MNCVKPRNALIDSLRPGSSGPTIALGYTIVTGAPAACSSRAKASESAFDWP